MSLGILTTQKQEALVEKINLEIDEAVETVKKEKFADPEEAYNDVYSDNFPVLRDENL